MSPKTKVVACKKCNAQIAKNVKICPSCGAKNKKPFYKRIWFIVLIAILLIGTISSIKEDKKEKYNWNEVELCERLPKPKSNVGIVFSNDSNSLSMYVEKTSKSDYKAYIEACKYMGYTVESEETGNQYDAFDEQGYRLSLNYIGETMYIDLDAPIEMGILNWPKSEIANLLPMPKSKVGKVSADTADGCYLYVGETSMDDFNTYADECSNCGFSVDYERGYKFYNAKDKDGNKLSLSYQGNNVMVIQISKADEVNANESETTQESMPSSTTEQEVEAIEEPSDSEELADGMRPEFKKAMDSYEEFMNEYCEFMKKYAESDGTDPELLVDYANYMSKCADMAQDFEAWDDGEMTTAEMAYYLDVQTRINKKLLELAE